MYKTISIANETYQRLHAIASRLDKPKAQLIDELVRGYLEEREEKERRELESFNTFVNDLAQRVKLPKGTTIHIDKMDEEFATLGREDI